jgi:hypothetical protein
MPLLLCACGLVNVNLGGAASSLGGSSDPEDESSSGSGKSSSKSSDTSDALRSDTKKMLNELDGLVLDKPDPIPADKIAALEGKGKELTSAGLKDEASYVQHVLTYYRLENAFRAEPAKTAEAVAKQLGGAVTAQGELVGKDKPVSFKFSAQAGKCYTVLSRMKNAGGDDDRMSGMFLDGGKDGSFLQRYDISPRTTRGAGLHRNLSKSYTLGACALKPMDVTFSASLQYAGTQNGLRYVVIEHARDKFPMYLAVDLEVRLNDSCDVESWTNMWMEPLPGAVLYGKSEPFLAPDVGTAEELWMTAWDAGQHEVRLQRKDVTSTPPKQFKFGSDFKFRGCPHNVKDAHSPDGIKAATCYEALDKRYNPQFDAAEKARDSATTLLAGVNAQKRLDALNNQYNDEKARTCGKIEAETAKKMEAVYNKIVDFYSSTPPKPPFDRAAEMQRQHEGVAEIICVNMSQCSL